MKGKSKKKENVQHVVRDPAKEADWGTANPFVNPLFYIIGLIMFPFVYFDEVDKLGHSWATFWEACLIMVFGWPIVFFIGATIIGFWIKEGDNIADSLEKKINKKKEIKNKEVESSNKSNEKTSSPGASGSAFFIDNKGHLITNNHVIKGFENRAKIFYDNEEVKLKFIACDEQLDLALLKANVKNEDFIEVADKVVKKMQNIVAAGYPLGKHLSDDLKFTSGIVSSLKGPGNNSAIMQIDAALNPGNSGGPIVDKEKGHLTGVAVAGLRKDVTEGINYGIKASRVKEFLESNRVHLKHIKKSSKDMDVSDKLENSTVYIFTY